MTKRLELKVENGALAGQRFSIGESGLRLGRSSSNDLAIRDEELSRNHCLFEPSGETGIRITDLVSANGTFVNACRLGEEAVELKEGDVVRVGETVLHVVGEGCESSPAPVDLGLDKTEAAADLASSGPALKSRTGLSRILLWGFAIVLVMVAMALLFVPPKSVPVSVPEAVPKQVKLLDMHFEKVVGDSSSIFRYDMAMTEDGVLQVIIDDLSGEGRHVSRRAQLTEEARKRLLDILLDEGLAALDREYIGVENEPPKLESYFMRYRTPDARRSVKIVNMQEPDAFRRVREKLEAFSMNELGIRALQYSREKLLEMAHAAANTGRMKWEDRDVEFGNLHAAICAYREAISDLETVNPKPPEFEEYRVAMDRATKELDERYKNQRFAAEQATSVGDWEKAKQELRTLCEMIPDREDARNREASVKLMDVEKRLAKKGARK